MYQYKELRLDPHHFQGDQEVHQWQEEEEHQVSMREEELHHPLHILLN